MFQLLISTIENNCMSAINLTIAPDLNPTDMAWLNIKINLFWV
jgi:hypothetical protein